MRPLILVTNDDGVSAPGIQRLVDYIGELGDIVVVAPATPQSGKSSALTVMEPLRIIPCPDRNGVKAYAVTGTPVDCVKLAMNNILERKPDLMLAGINHGTNSGTAIINSGTMGAVLEGCMQGVPSVGFSLLHHAIDADFSLSADYIKEITCKVLQKGLPDYVCLNVNIPAKVVPKGMKVCRAATGHWTEEYKKYVDPFGGTFFMLTGHFVNSEPEATDTDEYWLSQQYISVVPVTPDHNSYASIRQIESEIL